MEVAEQPRTLGAQLQHLADPGVVVARVGVVAAVDEAAPDLLAQVATRGVGQERLDGRAGVGDQPAALEAAGRGVGRRTGAHGFGESGEVSRVLEQQVALVLVGQQVLAELREQRREPLVDFGQPLLGGRVELRARPHEVGVGEPGESLLLRREPGTLARRIDGFDATEQRLVLRDPVAVGGDPRLDGALHLLHGSVVQRGAEDAVDGVGAVERPAGAFHLGDGVVEGGRRGVRRDAVEFGEVPRHALLEGGLQQRGRREVEGGHATEGPAPGRKQGVRGGRDGFGVAGGCGGGRCGGGTREGAEGHDQGAGESGVWCGH
jgi:hypothetical protein